MARTPKTKSKMSLHNKIKSKSALEDNEMNLTSTPNKKTNRLGPDKDYSPVFLPCTQESLENVDVLWDWNSPQSKTSYTRTNKRTTRIPSPKIPHKRNPPTEKPRSFEKLKEELRAFQNELKPTNEFRFDDKDLIYDKNRNELDDLFDDSVEAELVMASQQVEEKFANNVHIPLKSSPRNIFSKSFSSNQLGDESPVKKSPMKPPTNFRAKLQEFKNESLKYNDSFESALECFKEEDSELLSQADVGCKKVCEPKEVSNSALKLKTKSLSFGDHYTETRGNLQKLHDAKMRQLVERNRQEALAKLRAKKLQQQQQQQPQNQSDSDTSPVKCSPEEIEKKRRQALAKLEAKKQQELIEKKRQEALKRLEINRRKRAEAQRTASG